MRSFIVVLILLVASSSFAATSSFDKVVFNSMSGATGKLKTLSANGEMDVQLFANFSTAKASPLTAGRTIVVSNGQSANTCTIPSDRVVNIVNGGSLNIASGKTVINKGMIINQGTITGSGAFTNYSSGVFDHRGVLSNSGTVTNYGKFYSNGGTINTNSAIAMNGSFDAGLYQVFTGSGAVTFNTGGKVAYVQTIAQLRDLTGAYAHQAVQALGYYSAGDGGGGPVRYWDASSTATDNGGSIIKPTAISGANPGRWIWEWRAPVNVRWFGIAGSGTETTALQAAVDYTEANKLQLQATDITRITVTGIDVGSNADIDFGNTEIYLANSSNRPLIKNKSQSFSTRDISDVRIVGRKALNCNGAGQTDTATTGEWLCGVQFVGVTNLEFDIPVANSRRFAVWIVNVSGMKGDVLEIVHDDTLSSTNRDGLHINGNTDGISYRKLKVTGGDDDSLAINADDISFGGSFTQANVSGPIRKVAISEVYVDGRQGVRLLAATKEIADIYLPLVSGNIKKTGILIEPYSLGTGGVYRNVRFGKVRFYQNEFISAGFPFRFIHIDTAGAYISDIEIESVVRIQSATNSEQTSIPTINIIAQNLKLSVGSTVEFFCSNSETVKVTTAGGLINNELDFGFMTRRDSGNTAGSYASAVFTTGGGTIDRLSIGGIVYDKIRHFLRMAAGTSISVCNIGSARNAPESWPVYVDASTIWALNWQGITTKFSAAQYSTVNGGAITNIWGPTP